VLPFGSTNHEDRDEMALNSVKRSHCRKYNNLNFRLLVKLLAKLSTDHSPSQEFSFYGVTEYEPVLRTTTLVALRGTKVDEPTKTTHSYHPRRRDRTQPCGPNNGCYLIATSSFIPKLRNIRGTGTGTGTDQIRSEQIRADQIRCENETETETGTTRREMFH